MGNKYFKFLSFILKYYVFSFFLVSLVFFKLLTLISISFRNSYFLIYRWTNVADFGIWTTQAHVVMCFQTSRTHFCWSSLYYRWKQQPVQLIPSWFFWRLELRGSDCLNSLSNRRLFSTTPNAMDCTGTLRFQQSIQYSLERKNTASHAWHWYSCYIYLLGSIFLQWPQSSCSTL